MRVVVYVIGMLKGGYEEREESQCQREGDM